LLGAMKDHPQQGVEDNPTWHFTAFSVLFSAT
jgi:hypothetical protein